MNKTYLAIIFSLVLLLSCGFGSAALGQGSWTLNNEKTLSIITGESAEFTYSITAVTSMHGQYSIMLFKEGSTTPLKTYFLNTPTITNGALGKITVASSDYKNSAGSYYILINSLDDVCSDSYRLDLTVSHAGQSLAVSCSESTVSGNAPLGVQLSAHASGGSGNYTYTWSFGDQTSYDSKQNIATHVYSSGTYKPSVTVTDSNNNKATATCKDIVVTTAQNPITVACAAFPKNGTAPLKVSFTSVAAGGSGSYSYQWNFGDNGIITTHNNILTYTYFSEGTYRPTLTVVDSNNNKGTAECGEVIAEKQATPTSNMTATCSAAPTNGTVALYVQFNAAVTGGSGPYTYVLLFGDTESVTTPSTTSTSITQTHRYANAGTHHASLQITDAKGNVADADCGTITANAQPVTPPLTVDSINCFPRVTDNHNQSCSVFVSSNGAPAGNVDVRVYYTGGSLDGQLFGICRTDRISGGCEMEKVVHGVGKYTVYATASAPGYMSDNDTYPRYTFDVFAERYNVINLATYRDKDFFYPEDTFYRGQALYAKFQVYDPVANSFVTSDIVTAASLVSLPGGRIDLSRMTYSGNWYYYELKAIPLTHEFLGDSNVFAFAFNFTGMSSGQAQVHLTILNNVPVINAIDDVYVNVGQSYLMDLDNYGTDLEDHTLNWTVSENSDNFDAQLQAGNVLSILGQVIGDGTITLRGSDLDNDYATRTFNVHVIGGTISNFTASCVSNPTAGNAPLPVSFVALANGGSGNYNYEWTFGDNVVVSNSLNQVTNTYINAGTYSASVIITDRSNNAVATASCGTINVNSSVTPASLNVSCTALPQSGFIPLDVLFSVSVSAGSGSYMYTYDYGTGSSQTTQNSIAHNIYTSAGAFNALVHVTDSLGNSGNASCGLILANQDVNYTLVADPNGPYAARLDYMIMFNASKSFGSLGIINYVWDFGDGEIFNTTDPITYHSYDKIKMYTVKLTVYDAMGHSRTAYTTATITEQSTYQNQTFKHLPDKGLYIKQMTVFGNLGETFCSSDDLSVYLRVENAWDRKLDDVRMTVSIPEFGYEARSTATDIKKGQEDDLSVTLPFYDLPQGPHYVRIEITNDDNGDQVRRVKFREIIVVDCQ